MGAKRIYNHPFSEFGVAFVPWTVAEYVQYKGIRVDSPTYITTMIYKNYTDVILSNWEKTILEHTAQYASPKWSDLKTLDFEQLGLLTTQSNILEHREGWLVYLSIVLSLVCLAIITYILLKGILCKRCTKNLCHCWKQSVQGGSQIDKVESRGTQVGRVQEGNQTAGSIESLASNVSSETGPKSPQVRVL